MTAQLSEEVMATRGQRFFNYLIDSIVQYVVILGLITLIGLQAELIDGSVYFEEVGHISEWQEYFLELILMLLYYFLLEAFLQGRTVGKFATGTMVVDKNGDAATVGAILKRTLCRLIPFDAISFFGRRGWHDSISRTYVVRKEAWETSRQLQLAFDEIGSTAEEV